MKKINSMLKTRAADLLIQIVAIIFSVLLALAMNDWRENRKIQSTVRSVLSTLSDETIANQREVEVAFEYHKSLASKLQSEGLKLASINLKGKSINPLVVGYQPP